MLVIAPVLLSEFLKFASYSVSFLDKSLIYMVFFRIVVNKYFRTGLSVFKDHDKLPSVNYFVKGYFRNIEREHYKFFFHNAIEQFLHDADCVLFELH